MVLETAQVGSLPTACTTCCQQETDWGWFPGCFESLLACSASCDKWWTCASVVTYPYIHVATYPYNYTCGRISLYTCGRISLYTCGSNMYIRTHMYMCTLKLILVFNWKHPYPVLLFCIQYGGHLREADVVNSHSFSAFPSAWNNSHHTESHTTRSNGLSWDKPPSHNVTTHQVVLMSMIGLRHLINLC